jgi:CRISPR-associated endonuclease Cas1
MKKNKRKLYLWLPYLEEIKIKPKTAYFKYKGGKTNIQWMKIHSIMIYGSSPSLSQEFLEKCCFYKIPIVIHRRNLPKAVFITPTISQDKENILTKQIIYRENKKKKTYIAKKLLQAKFKSMSWLLPIKRDLLYQQTILEKMTSIESWHAKIYWKKYFESLNLNGSRRKEENIVKKTLDAVSKFTAGIVLRWILYHGLSPYHGFLHKPTDYPALVYDLMEPYRGYLDKVVFNTIKENNNLEESKILPYSIENIKKFLDQKIYVEATRQIVTFQELFHGIVLALRSYLLEETNRFVPPFPSKPNGGRPIKAGYQLYGHKAGITNFWPETKKISSRFEKIYFLNEESN